MARLPRRGVLGGVFGRAAAGMRPAGGQNGFTITMMTIGIANRTGISFQTR